MPHENSTVDEKELSGPKFERSKGGRRRRLGGGAEIKFRWTVESSRTRGHRRRKTTGIGTVGATASTAYTQ